MATQLSPGVLVTETNLSTVVPSVLTTAGAFAGAFNWGPVNKITPVDTETTLVNIFNQPDSNTYPSFFTAASFLAYGNNLQVVRAANTGTLNAVASGSAIQIPNKDAFQYSGLLQAGDSNNIGAFVARYPGALGNSLTVSVIDAGGVSGTWSNTTWNVVANTATGNTTVSLTGYFNGAPSTSYATTQKGGANDQLHIAVVDTGGLFSGTKGTVLEVFPYLSKAIDSVDQNGQSNYYKNAIFNNSKYIFAVDPVNYSATHTTWGLPAANTSFATLSSTYTFGLTGGIDATIQDNDIVNAMNLFADPTQTQVNLLITGPYTDLAVQTNAINIASTRKDCVAFISPPQSAVVNNVGSEQTSIISWMNTLSSLAGGPAGSYAFADSGWKYMFDRYNNAYRWVPLNGDVAGLCVYTDTNTAPWYSPAGYNRGVIKNVIKLAFNPTQSARDALYQVAVNPVVSFPGQGTVLFGDKTMQTQPSAFDRINVRRLFIVLEQAIAKAAQYSLFEFNDAFTQSQFVALVTPFLRQVQGQRGITAFQVVCDGTNNTPQVVDNNQFVGSIYIQPARSINFIQLNFVAVGTGVSFSTVTTTTA
jgi:DNA/RNA endonuclease YhcR with UshA esterase domain